MIRRFFIVVWLISPYPLFSQSDGSQEKIEKIRLNPDGYVNQGGILNDKIIGVSKQKQENIETEDFIIHVNNDGLLNETENLFYPHKLFLKTSESRDQAGQVYIQTKNNWIEENSVEYKNRTDNAEDRQYKRKSIERRRSIKTRKS